MKVGPKTKKFLKGFSRGWNAAKKGYSETARFTRTYGPRVNRGLGAVAVNIQRSFEPPRREDRRYVDFTRVSSKRRRRY